MKVHSFCANISNFLIKRALAVVVFLFACTGVWGYDYRMRNDADTTWSNRTRNTNDWSYYSDGILGIGRGWQNAGDDPGKNNNNDNDTVTLQYYQTVTVVEDVTVSGITISANPTISISDGKTLTPGSLNVNAGNALTVNTGTSGSIKISTIAGDDNSVKLTGSGTVSLIGNTVDDLAKLDISGFSGKYNIQDYQGNKNDLITGLIAKGVSLASVNDSTISIYENGGWSSIPNTATEYIIIAENFAMPIGMDMSGVPNLISLRIINDATLDVSGIPDFNIQTFKLSADSEGTLKSTQTISVSDNFSAQSLKLECTNFYNTYFNREVSVSFYSATITDLYLESGKKSFEALHSSDYGNVHSSNANTQHSIDCKEDYTINNIILNRSGSQLAIWGGGWKNANNAKVTINGTITGSGSNDSILFYCPADITGPQDFTNFYSIKSAEDVNNLNTNVIISFKDSVIFSNNGPASFTNLEMDGVTGTLTVNNDITITKSLVLKGINTTQPLSIEGNNTITIPSNLDTGDYLNVGTNVKIASPNKFTAEHSTANPAASIVAVIDNGWIIEDPKTFTYTWKTSPTNTNWHDISNWNVTMSDSTPLTEGVIPVSGAKIIIPSDVAEANWPSISEEIETGSNSVPGGSITIGSNSGLVFENAINLKLEEKTGGSAATAEINNNGTIVLKSTSRILINNIASNDTDSGLVRYAGATGGTISSSFNYYDLEIKEGTWNITSNTTVTNDLMLISGTCSNSAKVTASNIKIYDGTVTTSGTGDFEGTSTIEVTATATTPVLTGSFTSPSFTVNGVCTFNDVTINGALTNNGSITINANKNLSVTGNLTDSSSSASPWASTGILKLTGNTDSDFTAYTDRTYTNITAAKTNKTVTFKNPLTFSDFSVTSGNVIFEDAITITNAATLTTTGTITNADKITANDTLSITKGKLIAKADIEATKTLSLKDLEVDCADNASVELKASSITINGPVLPSATDTKSITLTSTNGTISTGAAGTITIGSTAKKFKNITINASSQDISLGANVTLNAKDKITAKGKNITFNNYVAGTELEVDASAALSIAGLEVGTLTITNATTRTFKNGRDGATVKPIKITNSDFTINTPITLTGDTDFEITGTGKKIILESTGSITPNANSTSATTGYALSLLASQIDLGNDIGSNSASLKTVTFKSPINFTSSDKTIYATTTEFADGGNIVSTPAASNKFSIKNDLLISSGATVTFPFEFTVPGSLTNNGTVTFGSTGVTIVQNFKDTDTFIGNITFNGTTKSEFTPVATTAYTVDLQKTNNSILEFTAAVTLASITTDETTYSSSLTFINGGTLNAATTFNCDVDLTGILTASPGISFADGADLSTHNSGTPTTHAAITGSTSFNSMKATGDGLSVTGSATVIAGKTLTLNTELTTTTGFTVNGTLTTESKATIGGAGTFTNNGEINIPENKTFICNTDFSNSANKTVSGKGNSTFTKNFTDSGKWTNTGTITLSGTAAQTFVPTTDTTSSYAKIIINKTSAGTPTGTVTFDTNPLKANTVQIINNGETIFNDTPELEIFKDVADGTTTSTAGKITFQSGATITNDVSFYTTADISISGEFNTPNTIFAATNAAVTPPLQKLITGASTTFNNFKIETGASLTTATSFTVKGNWTNNSDAFEATAGIIEFTGENTSGTTEITGNNTFSTIKFATPGQTIKFQAGKTQTITNIISQGSAAGTITLTTNASTPSVTDQNTWWNITLTNEPNTSNFNYTTIEYCNSTTNLLHDWGATVLEGAAGSTNKWFYRTFYWFGKTDTSWDTPSNWSYTETYTACSSSPLKTTGINEIYIIDTNSKVLKLSSDINVKSIEVYADKKVDFDNYSITTTSITNKGHVRLEGSQTITAPAGRTLSITNSASSTVEYYGSCTNLPMSDNKTGTPEYQNLQFTNGATGTVTDNITVSGTTLIANGIGEELKLTGSNIFTGDITIGVTTPAEVTGGALTLNSSGNIKIATGAKCDSLIVTAASKEIELKGSVTATGAVNLTCNEVKTTNTATPSADLSASNFNITGNLSNTGKTKFTNGVSLTGNVIDTGTFEGTISLIGTNPQEFTANNVTPPTAYTLIINKDSSDAGVSSGSVEFKNQITIDSITTTAPSVATAATLLFDNGLVLNNDANFTIPVEVASADSNPAKITASGKNVTFVSLTLNSSTEITATNTYLNGNIKLPSGSTNHLKITGALDAITENVEIAPSVMLNGDYTGTKNALFNKDLFIIGNSQLKNLTVTGDLIFDSQSTYKTNGTITAKNIVLYKGDIQAAADSTLKASGNVILLGTGFTTPNPSIELEKSRLQATGYSRSDFTAATTMPDGTSLPVIDGFTGTYQGNENSVIFAGKNFYANGVTFTSADSKDWFIDLPDIRATANGFAEAFNCNVEWSHIRCHNPVSDDGTIVKLPAYNCNYPDPDNNKWWLFEDFKINLAYTVRDNSIRVEFNHPVRNNTNEVNNAIASIKNSEGSFEGIYKDPDCQTKYENEDVIIQDDVTQNYYFYLKSPDSWNTDATGTDSGITDSTDRNGSHKSVIPFIDYSSNIYALVNIWGKRLTPDADGDGGSSSIRTNVLDHTGPVLTAVLTGQEQHTPYNNVTGAASQPSYDAHNFIEFHYSEPVNLGDPTLGNGTATDNTNVYDNANLSSNVWLPANAPVLDSDGFYATQNVRVRDNLGAIAGDITASSNVTLAGLGTLPSGKIHTGSNGNNDKYVNSLYRIDPYTIRLSIAGYTEGTTTDRDGNTYKNWKGYIESATQPSGNVTMNVAINPMVTDCAVQADGTTPIFNPQEKYLAGQTEPKINSGMNEIDWDLSEPVFAPLRLRSSTEWASSAPDKATYYEAVGNTAGAGSTLHKIEFHFFDNTPDYATSEFAWLTEKGWVNNVLNSKELYKEYTYCADIFGGSRQFNPDPSKRTTGGLRFSSISHANTAFKYIATQAGNPIPDIPFSQDADAIFPGAKAPLFTGSSATRRAADDPDGLYFGIKLPDTSMSLDRSFTISYDEQQGYITDLAGNRLRSATIKTIDRTPPTYDFMLSPLNQNEIYMVFVKELQTESQELYYNDSTGTKINISEDFESLIPKCFQIFTMDTNGNYLESTDLQIDYSVPAKIAQIESNVNHQIFTTITLTLNKNVTLKHIEETYIRVKIPDGYTTSQDPVTGLNNSNVTFIQDEIGNYMQIFNAHALSDFAIGAINPLYAYDQDMEYNETKIMDGLYEEGSWAVHDWNSDQQNYGTLPANHPFGIVADIDDGTEGLDCKTAGARIFLTSNPAPNSVSKQINSDLNLNLRIWLPELQNGQFQFMALENTPASDYYTANSQLLDSNASSERLLMEISKDISQNLGANKQISFIFGLLDSNQELIRIYNAPYYDVANNKYNLRLSTPVPLYALRLTNPKDVMSLDLWSLKTKSITEQRGGVTVLNNVINATNGEQVAVKVNMPSEGKLNVIVMTLDGNVVTYLNHGQTNAGEHYYSWNGKNNKGNLVGRGMYFIRVVGNGIDETRKVMVVK